MKINSNYIYTKSHEWLNFIDDTTAYVGITDFAQESLGELVFVNLPCVSDTVVAEEAFADVESVKAVADIYSPVTGIVCEVNNELSDNPALLNEQPYDTWIAKIKNITFTSDIMNAQEYEEFCENEN